MVTSNWLRSPFTQAVDYLQEKVPVPTEGWEQFEAEQHDHAFTVAGLTKVNLLEDLQKLVTKAIADGTDIEDFKKQFKSQIEDRGWSPKPLPAGPSDYRVRIIFETNVRRANAKGRREQMMRVTGRPYWMWVWRDSPNPRLHHQALDGKVFRSTDPFWRIAYPPCGFGCKCGVVTLSESDMKRRGLTVSTPPDPQAIAEKGFRSAAGSSPKSERSRILQEGLKNHSPVLKTQVMNDLRKRGVI